MSPLPSGTRFPIQVISTIKPANNAPFPVASDVDVEGGYQVRTTIVDRNSIPTNNRKEGMLVFVQENSIFYTLEGGITNSNWVVANLTGQGPNYDLTGSSSETTVGRINNFPVGGVNTPSGYLAAVPEYDNLHLFKTTTRICSDGSHIWSASAAADFSDQANFTKTVLVDYGASYALSYYTMFQSEATGSACAVNPNISPYLFLVSAGSERLLIVEKSTDQVIGIGETGAQRFTNLAIDKDGNIWATSVTHGDQLNKFNTEAVIAGFSSPVLPIASVSLLAASSDLFYDETSMWAIGGTFIERIDASSTMYIGNYDASVDFPGIVYKGICVVDGFAFVTAVDQIHRFNVGNFIDGPDVVVPASGAEFGQIVFSNGYLWVVDTESGNLHQFDLTLDQVNVFFATDGRSGIEEGFAIARHPTSNEIYVGVSGAGSDVTGIMTFNTESLEYNPKRLYMQRQLPQIKSVTANCDTTFFPENPFVGQMVFAEDQGMPFWWDGVNWVNYAGDPFVP